LKVLPHKTELKRSGRAPILVCKF